MAKSRNIWTWLWLCVFLGWSVSVCAGQDAGIEAITRPSEDITMSFVRLGRIAEMKVKKGDVVKVGQLLAAQDQKVEQAEIEQLKAQADDMIRVDAQLAQLAQKKVDLLKLEEALKRKVATKWEVEHARLDVTIAELSVKLARFEQVQAKRKHEQAKLQIERMKLTSPIDGTVEEVHMSVGESADARDKVLRLVKIDPLWIDVPVPRKQADRLVRGQPAQVEFRRPDGAAAAPAPLRGKVVHIAAVGDAASGTTTVRIEAPNPTKRRAGEHVRVFFPTDAKATKASDETAARPKSAGAKLKE